MKIMTEKEAVEYYIKNWKRKGIKVELEFISNEKGPKKKLNINKKRD